MAKCRRILVVDDDRRVLFILDRTLTALAKDFKVETARTGQEALEKARGAAPDVLVTDLLMPGVGGVELTRAVKQLNPDTAVIWITAYGCLRFEAERAKLGVFRCLEKPLKVQEIRQAVLDAAKDV